MQQVKASGYPGIAFHYFLLTELILVFAKPCSCTIGIVCLLLLVSDLSVIHEDTSSVCLSWCYSHSMPSSLSDFVKWAGLLKNIVGPE